MDRIKHITENKFFLIYVILGCILAVIFFAIIFLNFSDNETPGDRQPIPTLTPALSSDGNAVTNVEVDKVIPDEPSGLTSGRTHSFYIHFKNPVKLSDLDISVQYKYIYEDTLEPLTVETTEKLLGDNTVEVKTVAPVLQGAEYTVIVEDRLSQVTLSSTSYISLDLEPTPVQNNNQALNQYLPHEASTYSLEYLPRENIYLFHFILNIDSEIPFEEQFVQAQQEATQFIQSKGIDMNSVVIEWRRN